MVVDYDSHAKVKRVKFQFFLQPAGLAFTFTFHSSRSFVPCHIPFGTVLFVLPCGPTPRFRLACRRIPRSNQCDGVPETWPNESGGETHLFRSPPVPGAASEKSEGFKNQNSSENQLLNGENQLLNGSSTSCISQM